jgi:tetratricopeptide (TPR) repeat protein
MTNVKPMSEKTIHYLVLLLFSVVGFCIYSNTFDVPFIFDDSDNIQNPSLRISELSADSLLKAAVESSLIKRPVPNISFAINYYFGEYNVRGYHLVNIFIHVATAFFLYLLLEITFKFPSNRDNYRNFFLLPACAALLWLTNPLATQSVTYLVQRMNSMAAMFYVLSVLCYVQGRLKGKRGDDIQTKIYGLSWFAASITSGALAIGSKEIAVTLPVGIFLYEWFFFQNLDWKWLKKKIPWIVALFLFLYCAAYFYLGGNPLQKVFNSCNNRPFSSLERMLTECRVVIYYIGLLLYPSPNRLVFDYNYPLSTSLFSPLTTIFSIISLLLMLGVTICIARKERFLAFCILWFLLNLVLESSVICLEIIFEHRTYLPSMFLLAIIPALLFRIGLNKHIVTGILLAFIVCCGYWTLERNKIWQNPIRFWQDSADKQPLKARGYNNLGVALYEAKKFKEAGDNFVQAFTLLPNFPEAYSNLGLIQVRQNQLIEAEKNFKYALTLRSHYIAARLNLAALYKEQGKYSTAEAEYRKLYSQIPEYSVLNKELGQVLLRMGRIEESLAFLEKAYKKLPKNTYLLLDRGEAFMRSGKLEEAMKSYMEVLDIEDGNVGAHYNLGLILGAIGKEEAALVHYQKVELLRSADVPVLYNLGNLYLRLGAFDNARASYMKFIEASAAFADAYNNLGLVNIKKTELSEAMENFQSALRINPDHYLAAQNLTRVKQELKEKEGKNKKSD